MRRHLLVVFALAGLVAWAAPAPAQHPAIGLNAALGCDVFVGQGEGQILTPLNVLPMLDVGTVIVEDLAGERSYTLVWEGVTFPMVFMDPAEPPYVYEGVGSWRLLENEVQGTNRYRMIVKPDPAEPGMTDFHLEGEVLRGNRYATGRSHLVGRCNLLTGAYTVSFYSIVLCRP